jgi:hypothetical protein
LLREDKSLPEREKHMIQAKEMVIAIVWNPIGFYIVDVFSKGQIFNAVYYNECILQQVLEFRLK